MAVIFKNVDFPEALEPVIRIFFSQLMLLLMLLLALLSVEELAIRG